MKFNTIVLFIIVSVCSAQQLFAMHNLSPITGLSKERAFQALNGSLNQMDEHAKKASERLAEAVVGINQMGDELVRSLGSEGLSSSNLSQSDANKANTLLRYVLPSGVTQASNIMRTLNLQSKLEHASPDTASTLKYMQQVVDAYNTSAKKVLVVADGFPFMPIASLERAAIKERAQCGFIPQNEADDLENLFAQIGSGDVQGLVYIDPEYAKTLSKEEALFGTRHELNHIVLNHTLFGVRLQKHTGEMFSDDTQATDHRNAYMRCTEREADVRACVDAQGFVDSDATKGAMAFLHKGFFNKNMGAVVVSLCERLKVPGIDVQQLREVQADKLHPKLLERMNYIRKLVALADAQGYISPEKLDKFVVDCDDCRYVASDFFAQARLMARKATTK